MLGCCFRSYRSNRKDFGFEPSHSLMSEPFHSFTTKNLPSTYCSSFTAALVILFPSSSDLVHWKGNKIFQVHTNIFFFSFVQLSFLRHQLKNFKIKRVPCKAGQETADRLRIKRLGTATRLPDKANGAPPPAHRFDRLCSANCSLKGSQVSDSQLALRQPTTGDRPADW